LENLLGFAKFFSNGKIVAKFIQCGPGLRNTDIHITGKQTQNVTKRLKT